MSRSEHSGCEIGKLRVLGERGQLAPPPPEPSEQGAGLEPQEGEAGFDREGVNVIKYGGSRVDVRAEPIHDCGGVRVPSTASVADGRGETERQSIHSGPLGIVQREVEDVRTDKKCLPLAGEGVSLTRSVDGGYRVEIP